MASPRGPKRLVLVAGPPSPENPAESLPAMVIIVPEAAGVWARSECGRAVTTQSAANPSCNRLRISVWLFIGAVLDIYHFCAPAVYPSRERSNGLTLFSGKPGTKFQEK